VGTISTRPTSVGRRLVGASVIATLLGLLRPTRAVHATNGDPAILGDPNEATSTTELIGHIVDEAVLLVEAGSVNGEAKASSTAILAQGRGPTGYGVVAKGGPSGSGYGGGAGLQTTGGQAGDKTVVDESIHGGPGLIATGGKSGTGTGGDGAYAVGGTSELEGGAGTSTNGPEAAMYDGARGSGPPGIPALGSGACGVLAVAAKGAGPGVVAIGGRLEAGAPFHGGEGLVAVGGVRGETSARNRNGVNARHATEGPGLLALSSANSAGLGLHGLSLDGLGGLFISDKGAGAVSHGVVEGASVTGYAIVGESQSGAAIYGHSMTGVGVSGASLNGPGGHFVAETADQYAVQAINTAATAADQSPKGVLVRGDWVVENGVKSAAVPTSKGLSLLYAIEGPVAMFEDVGSVRLTAGRGRVELDPIFAETIDTSDYFVFASPRGETPGVYVASQDGRGFELREQGAGTSTLDVSYRVVARRKGLAEGHRLAPFAPRRQGLKRESRRIQLPPEPLPPVHRPKRPDKSGTRFAPRIEAGGAR
jgi:hypothetical protein